MNKNKCIAFLLLTVFLSILAPTTLHAEQAFEVYPLDKQGGAIPLFQNFGVEAVGAEVNAIRQNGRGWIALPSTVTTYRQRKWNYGSAATIQSYLDYLDLGVINQENIATGIGITGQGATMYQLVDYLRNEAGLKNIYGYLSVRKDYVLLNFYKTLVDKEKPVILAVHHPEGDGFPYASKQAHWVMLYAVREDLSEFCVSDPFVNYAGLTGVKHYYSVTSEDLYKAYIAAGSGFVIED